MFVPSFFFLLWLDENTVVTRGAINSENGIYSVSVAGEIHKISASTAGVCVRDGDIYQVSDVAGCICILSARSDVKYLAVNKSSKLDLTSCRLIPNEIFLTSRFASLYFLSDGYLAVFDEDSKVTVGYFDADSGGAPRQVYDLSALGSKLFRVKEFVDGAKIAIFPLAFSSQLRADWIQNGNLRFAVISRLGNLEWRSIAAGPWIDEHAIFDFDAVEGTVIMRVGGFNGDIDSAMNGLYNITSSSIVQLVSGNVYSFALSANGNAVALIRDGHIKSLNGKPIPTIDFISLK